MANQTKHMWRGNVRDLTHFETARETWHSLHYMQRRAIKFVAVFISIVLTVVLMLLMTAFGMKAGTGCACGKPPSCWANHTCGPA